MRIFNFLGLVGEVFSRGLYDLSDRLEDEFDCISTVHNWPEWKSIKERTIRNGDKKEPIVIIGHSLGARAAIKLSKALKEAGFNVVTCICYDYVHNLIGKNDLVATKGVPTYHFMSRDIRVRKLKGAKNISYKDLSHIQLDNSPLIRDETVDILGRLL